ncbi:hypothetical protein BH20PSE1_BH20PSE1_01560 [soil metagenome]
MSASCCIEGCTKKVHLRRMCRVHYHIQLPTGQCAVSDCERKAFATGMCLMHYKRKRKEDMGAHLKLTNIKIRSFLGIDSLDLAIEKPVILISGFNASGKTSLSHALRFVLLGSLCRVSLKKNIKALLRDGAKLGSVTVGIVNGDGEIIEYQRSAATGHYTSANPPPTPHPALAYLLDPPAFLALASNERRQFLFNLAGVSLSASGIVDKLKGRGHTTDTIKRVANELRDGFVTARIEAQALARDGKTQWHEITGEDWGSLKGGTWAADSQLAPEEGASQLAPDLASVEGAIAEMQAKIGARREREKQRAGIPAAIKEAEDLERRAELREKLKKDLGNLVSEEESLRMQIADAEKKASFADLTQGTFGVCPECNTPLIVSRGFFQKGAAPTQEVLDKLNMAAAHADSLRSNLKSVQHKRNQVSDALNASIEAFGRASAARAALNAIPKDPVGQGESMTADLAVLTGRRSKLQAAIRKNDEALKAVVDATKKTERARALHNEIQAINKLADDLAPDGLPAELLAAALGPINARLQDSAAMTGWPLIRIDTEEIWMWDRPLSLASDSERWRATAMIAEAIAALSGIKMFCLDGLDILDAPSRAQALAWLTAIAPEHESIICMATLKARPANLPEAVQLCWLGPPPAMTKEEAQAFEDARMRAAGEFSEEMAGQ